MRSIGPHREDPPAEGVGAADDVSTAVHPGEGDPAAVRRPDRIEFVQRRFLPRDPPAVGANDVDVPRCVVVAVLDAEIPVGRYPDDPDQLLSLLTLLAYAHGEWVRIHPFANGNGRTARLWANWCALRYNLPAFVRLKPRPEGSLYANAAAASMGGDHQRMIVVFAEMLDRYLAARPTRSAS